MTFDIFVQAVVNGLISGTILAVLAIGFTAIFAICRYPNFMIGSIATVGAYAGSVANTQLGLPLPAALAFSAFVAAAIGLVSEKIAVRPLEHAGPLTMAIASLAMSIAIENLLRFIFGNDLRGFNVPLERDIIAFSIRIGPQQLYNLMMACTVLLLLWAGLRHTRWGRAMRAVADNADLARSKGVDPVRVADVTILIAMGLCGLGGTLIGLDSAVDPQTGGRLLLSIFAAAVLGGLGSLPGALLGALCIGIAEEFTVAYLSPDYRLAVGFVIILLVLTMRPRGLLGAQIR